MKELRLDKIISSQTSLSRKEASDLIKKGCLILNGEAVLSGSVKADPEKDIIVFRGERLFYNEHTYIMMNKPKGVISASTDKNAKTVLDLVPEEMRRDGLFPAGRLDKDTTGFILLTDDGDFAHKILSPKNHVYKTYVAGLEKEISAQDISVLEKGIELSDGTVFQKCSIKLLENNAKRIEIKIREGKYHQIKRMLKFVGNEVVSLERIKMGNLLLDKTLLPGSCRLLTKDEIKLISNFDE